MKIAIALYDRFTALDAIGPYETLSRIPGAEVVFVGCEQRIFRTDIGALAVLAGASFADVDRADVLVVPGGPGTRAMMTDQPLLDWVRKIHATTQWTTSVCTGSLVLGAAGILKDVDATTHWACMGELASTGAKPTDQRVVIRGKIVTAAGVSAGIDMGLTLAARIAGEDVAKAIQLGIEYDPQPPFDSGSVHKATPETVGIIADLMRQVESAHAAA
ncbi:MAG: DJ-1/PfpI family protein [Deltaproteobacteria bacterium]|nr:DJ-1/PfpI family protein [Deltaproteobacteria bacterium]